MKYGPEYGARILDRYMPNWREKFDPLRFDICSGENCVAGMLFEHKSDEGGYYWFENRGPYGYKQAVRMGFQPGLISTYTRLESQWIEIAQRKA